MGTVAEITVTLPTEQTPLQLTGRVVWVHTDPDRESVMGIGFDELPEPARRVLANYVLRSSGATDADQGA